MKKLLMFMLTAALATAALAAAEAKKPLTEAKKPLTEAEKAARNELRLQKTGGILQVEGKGRVVIVNAQQKFAAEAVTKQVEALKKIIRVNVEVRSGAWKFGDRLPADANAAIYLVDEATLPMSLVAMESHWGVMNVAALKGDRQFEREFTRVSIATLGAGVSQYRASPMQPVSTPADLDRLTGNATTVDASNAMIRNLEEIGVTRPKLTTYRKACEEGWAASPTNKYQQAIWDEVHALPSKPLKLRK